MHIRHLYPLRVIDLLHQVDPAITSAQEAELPLSAMPPMRVAKTIATIAISEKPKFGSLSEMNAARMPIGTTPTPAMAKPISRPVQPQVENVTVAPRNHVVRPNK